MISSLPFAYDAHATVPVARNRCSCMQVRSHALDSFYRPKAMIVPLEVSAQKDRAAPVANGQLLDLLREYSPALKFVPRELPVGAQLHMRIYTRETC
eukprot:6205723-Pleurochrysis_carterae.AAC.1